MSTLKERLKRIKENFLKKASPEAVEVMNRSTEALQESGIMDRIPEVGSRLPAFDLLDTEGEHVRSDDILSRGLLVLTFYRGAW